MFPKSVRLISHIYLKKTTPKNGGKLEAVIDARHRAELQCVKVLYLPSSFSKEILHSYDKTAAIATSMLWPPLFTSLP